jgi:hypothetical protein
MSTDRQHFEFYALLVRRRGGSELADDQGSGSFFNTELD